MDVDGRNDVMGTNLAIWGLGTTQGSVRFQVFGDRVSTLGKPCPGRSHHIPSAGPSCVERRYKEVVVYDKEGFAGAAGWIGKFCRYS